MADKLDDNMMFVKALLYPRDEHYNVMADATPEPVLVNVNTKAGCNPMCIHKEGPMTYVVWNQLQIDLDEYRRARLARANIRPAIINDYVIDVDDETDPDELNFVLKDEHEVRALVHMDLSNESGALCEREDGRMTWRAWGNIRFTDTSGRIDLFRWDMPDDTAEEEQTHDGQDDD